MKKKKFLNKRDLSLFLLGLVFVSRVHTDVTVDARNLGLLNSNNAALTAPEAVVYSAAQTPSGAAIYRGYVSFVSSLTIEANGSVFFDECVGWVLGSLIFGNANSILDIGSVGMRCGSTFSMTGPGQIRASGSLPGVMFLSGNLTVSHVFNIRADAGSGQVVIDGGGKTLTIGSGGQFVINYAGSGTLTLRNMKLVLATTTPFKFPNNAGASKLTLQNVDIFLDPSLSGAVSFDASGSHYGQLVIQGCVSISGQGKSFDYNSNGTFLTPTSSILIDDNASLTVNRGVTFKLSSDLTPINEKIYLKGTSSSLIFNGSTFQLPVTGLTYPGLQLERGNLIFSNKVHLSNEGNDVAIKGLILGDGSLSANNVNTKVCSGAAVILNGYLFHNPA